MALWAIEHVDELTDGLTDDKANYRPGPNANSIAWLIWHSARVQDVQLAPIAGVEQVWTADGWVDPYNAGWITAAIAILFRQNLTEMLLGERP